MTFPNGRRAELAYPRKLRVEFEGVSPYAFGTLHGRSRWPGRSDFVQRDFRIWRGDVEDVLAWWNSGERPSLIAEYRGRDGRRIGLWDLTEEPDVHYLGFQFGGWAVLVYDYTPDGSSAGAQMSEAERAAWVNNFHGFETRDGFLVLKGSGPLRLRGFELSFSGGAPSRRLTLYPGPCRPQPGWTQSVGGTPVRWESSAANWCVPGGATAYATGKGRFIEALIRGLEIL